MKAEKTGKQLWFILLISLLLAGKVIPGCKAGKRHNIRTEIGNENEEDPLEKYRALLLTDEAIVRRQIRAILDISATGEIDTENKYNEFRQSFSKTQDPKSSRNNSSNPPEVDNKKITNFMNFISKSEYKVNKNNRNYHNDLRFATRYKHEKKGNVVTFKEVSHAAIRIRDHLNQVIDKPKILSELIFNDKSNKNKSDDDYIKAKFFKEYISQAGIETQSEDALKTQQQNMADLFSKKFTLNEILGIQTAKDFNKKLDKAFKKDPIYIEFEKSFSNRDGKLAFFNPVDIIVNGLKKIKISDSIRSQIIDYVRVLDANDQVKKNLMIILINKNNMQYSKAEFGMFDHIDAYEILDTMLTHDGFAGPFLKKQFQKEASRITALKAEERPPEEMIEIFKKAEQIELKNNTENIKKLKKYITDKNLNINTDNIKILSSGSLGYVFQRTTDNRIIKWIPESAVSTLKEELSVYKNMLKSAKEKMRESTDPEDGKKYLTYKAYVEEIERIQAEELDVSKEVKNAELLTKSYEGIKDIKIISPILPKKSDGKKRSQINLQDLAKGKSLKQFLEKNVDINSQVKAQKALQNMFNVHLDAVFSEEYFHADLHPGNIYIDFPDGKDTASLQIIDHGNVTKMEPIERAALAGLIRLDITRAEIEGLIKARQSLDGITEEIRTRDLLIQSYMRGLTTEPRNWHMHKDAIEDYREFLNIMASDNGNPSHSVSGSLTRDLALRKLGMTHSAAQALEAFSSARSVADQINKANKNAKATTDHKGEEIPETRIGSIKDINVNKSIQEKLLKDINENYLALLKKQFGSDNESNTEFNTFRDNLNSNSHIVEQTIQNLQRQTQIAQEMGHETSTEIEEKMQHIEEVKRANAELTEMKDQLEEELRKERAQSESYATRSESQNKKIQDLTTKLQTLQQEQARQNQKLRESFEDREKLKKLEKELTEREENIKRLSEELKNNTANNTSTESKLEAEIKELQNINKEIESQYAKQSEEIAKERDQTQKNIQKLQQELQNKDTDITTLQEKLAQATANYKKSMAGARQQSQNRVKKLKEEIQGLSQKATTQEAEIQTNNQELTEARESFAKNPETDQTNQKIKDLENENKRLQSEMEQTKKEIEKNKSLIQKINEKQDQIDELQKQTESLSAQIQQTNDLNISSEAEKEDLRSNMLETTEELKTLEEQYAKITKQLDEESASKADLNKKLTETSQQLSASETTKENMEQRLQEVLKTTEQQRAEIELLKERISEQSNEAQRQQIELSASSETISRQLETVKNPDLVESNDSFTQPYQENPRTEKLEIKIREIETLQKGLEETNMILNEKNVSSQQIQEELMSQNESFSRQIQDLETNKDVIQSQVDELTRHNTELEKLIDSQKKLTEELEEQLRSQDDANRNETDQLRNQLQELAQEKQRLQAEIAESEAKLANVPGGEFVRPPRPTVLNSPIIPWNDPSSPLSVSTLSSSNASTQRPGAFTPPDSPGRISFQPDDAPGKTRTEIRPDSSGKLFGGGAAGMLLMISGGVLINEGLNQE